MTVTWIKRGDCNLSTISLLHVCTVPDMRGWNTPEEKSSGGGRVSWGPLLLSGHDPDKTKPSCLVYPANPKSSQILSPSRKEVNTAAVPQAHLCAVIHAVSESPGVKKSPGSILIQCDSLESHPPSAGPGLGTQFAALTQLQISVRHKCYLSLFNY